MKASEIPDTSNDRGASHSRSPLFVILMGRANQGPQPQFEVSER